MKPRISRMTTDDHFVPDSFPFIHRQNDREVRVLAGPAPNSKSAPVKGRISVPSRPQVPVEQLFNTAMMTRTRTAKVKEFVNPPFIQCPDCQVEGKFGVLMISERQYTRRCINCWFDKTYPLPRIHKKVVYVDQFVISNIMKELDPAAPAKPRSPQVKRPRRMVSVES